MSEVKESFCQVQKLINDYTKKNVTVKMKTRKVKGNTLKIHVNRLDSENSSEIMCLKTKGKVKRNNKFLIKSNLIDTQSTDSFSLPAIS